MEKMVRKASDNKYFHRHFHVGLNLGIDYIAELFGEDAVKEYLAQYTRVYHKPLIEKIKKDGLNALREYFVWLYTIEEAPEVISFEAGDDELIIDIEKCPVIEYIKSEGEKTSPFFIETTNTINKTLVEDTPYAFKMISYDKQTGKSRQRFYKKEA